MKRATRLPLLACAAWAAIASTTAQAQDASPADDSRARVIPGSCVKPEYPLSSLRKQETGTSAIELKVDTDGTVMSTTVRQSSGSRLLDQAAAYAMRSCRFKPARDTTGWARVSDYPMTYEWRLEDAPKDPWVGLRALAGGGFAPTSDFETVPFAGDSAGNAEQRAKMLQAVRGEALEKAQCASIERVSARIGLSDTVPERRSFESWTVQQCGQAMRYLVAIAFPEGKRPQFRFLPLAAGEADPLAGAR